MIYFTLREVIKKIKTTRNCVLFCNSYVAIEETKLDTNEHQWLIRELKKRNIKIKIIRGSKNETIV